MRLNYRRTFLLGSAFFGLQALFAVYNAYLPIFLQSGRADFRMSGAVQGGFGLSATFTGFVMSLDNLAAMLILPYIGARSDATVSRLGKRKPYILLGAPLAALAFAAIPQLLGQPLWLFMLVVLLMILALDVIRTPIMALMPDITPSPLRSQATGVINLMGGVGAMVALLAGGALYRQSPSTPFFFGALTLLAGCLLVVVMLPTPAEHEEDVVGDSQSYPQTMRNGERGFLHDLRAVRHEGDHSLVYLLATIFCLFWAYSALTVFFTSFAVVTLRVARGQEAQLLSLFALAIVVFALPAGLLSGRIGRRPAILLGLVIFTVATTPMVVLTNLVLIRGLLLLGGLGWALLLANLLPMVLDSAPVARLSRIGAFTGMYFLATQSAEVVGPLLVGGFLDLTGRDYRLIFVYTLVVVVIAGACLTRVRRGEPRSAGAELLMPD